MRSEKLYLRDIVDATQAIAKFLTGKDRDAFFNDDLLQSSVLQKLTVIGEVASRISKDLKDKYGEIGWHDIVAFRNIAVHAYFSIDWSIVWKAATKNAPELRRKS